MIYGAVVVTPATANDTPADRVPLPREGTAAVGTVGGAYTVTDHGRAGYSVPIDVPPGIAGLQPAVSLEHESGRREGLVGRGWTVAGQSVIERCALSNAQGGGTPQPIAAAGRTGATAYCLDGQLLVEVARTPGTGDGVEYRTEEETWVKVVARQVGETGPAGFDVWTREGRLRRYGFTADSVDGFPHRRWRLSQEADRSGNLIDTVYRTDCRDPQTCTEPAVSEIRYGGRADQSHDRLVRFVYDTTAPERVTYSRGERRADWRRLVRVETNVDGAVVRDYRLDYRTKDDSSTLSAIRECVRDVAGDVCKPPTTLEHITATGYPGTVPDSEAQSLVGEAFGNAPLSSRQGQTVSLDVNGDGRDDLMYPADDGDYRLSVATGDRSRPWNHLDTGIVAADTCVSQENVGDLDGDGSDDIVTCGWHPNGATVLISVGDGFRRDTTMVAAATAGNRDFWLADLDGDSRTDILTCNDPAIWTNSGAAFTRTVTGFEFPRSAYVPGSTGTPVPGLGCTAPVFLDVDGDGVVNALLSSWTFLNSEFLEGKASWERWRRTFTALTLRGGGASPVLVDSGLAPEVTYNTKEKYVHEAPATGSPPKDPTPGPLNGPPHRQFRQVDDNGDGLTDLLVLMDDDIRLYTNTGNGFVTGPNLQAASWDWKRVNTPEKYAATRFYDIDGDGRTDALLPVGDGNGWVLHRAGAGPEQAGSWPADPLPLVPADVDGDGSRDLVIAVPAGEKKYRLTVRYGDQARSGLLRQVVDGVGRRVTFSYAGGSSVYSRSRCTGTGSWCLSRTGPLVSQVAVHAAQRPSGWSPVETFRYTYQNARIGWFGRGFLGMERRVRTAVDPDGKVLATVTREFGNRQYIRAASGGVAHRFPGAGRLIAETTESGPVESGDDRTQRMVSRTTITAAQLVSTDGRPFAYDQVSNVVTEAVDARSGNATRLGSNTVRTVMDTDGNVESTVTTRLNRDGEQVVKSAVTATFDRSAQRREQRLFGLVTRRVETEERGGRTVARTTGFGYTADRGLLERVTNEPDDAASTLVTGTSYDRFGNPVRSEQSAPGAPGLGSRVVTTGWDDRGLLRVSSTDAAGHTSAVVRDRAFGTPLVEADPNGVVIRTAYDGFGRTVRKRTAVGDTMTTYERVDVDATADRAARVRTTQTVQGGKTTITETDAAGRTVRAGSSGYQGAMVFTDTVYDAQGHPATISRPYRGDTAEARSRYRHDVLGRLRVEAQPDEQSRDDEMTTTRFAYTALGAGEQIDGAGQAVQDVAATRLDIRQTGVVPTVEVKDLAGDVVARRDTNGALTQFVRGPFGVVDRIIDPDGKVTRFETDTQGRTVAVDSPDAGRHTYSWTPFGDLRQQRDAAGRVTEFGYDTLGRLRSRTDADGAATWEYDGPGANTIGKLTGSRTAAGYSAAYTYEPVPAGAPNRGLLTSSTETIDGTSLVIRFGYDAYGRVVRTEYPESAGRPFAVDNRYDDTGNLVDVRQAGGTTPFWQFTGADDGQRISDEKLGGDITVHSTFGELSGRRTRMTAQRGGTVVHDLAVAYDEFGKVDGVTDGVDPAREDVSGYDTDTGSQRLYGWGTSESVMKEPEIYTFRTGGQIDSKEGVGDYRYESRPHAVVAAGRNTYTYDAAGRQIERTGPDVAGGRQRITYTATGLTAAVDTAGSVTGFGYDPAGQRVLRKTTDTVTRYASDLYEQHQDQSAGTVEHRYHVRVHGRTVARVVRSGDSAADTVSYLISDHVGSPRTVLSAGDDRRAQQWTAYGRPVDAGQRPDGDIGFAGQREDPGLGLVATGGRMYDPVLGRFLAPDPVLFDVSGGKSPGSTFAARVSAGKRPAGGPPLLAADLLDPYAYAGNNPSAYVDPTGLAPQPAGVPVQTSVGHWGSAALGYTTGYVTGSIPFGWIFDPGIAAFDFGPTFEFNRAFGGLAASGVKAAGGLGGMNASAGAAGVALAATPAGGVGAALAVPAVGAFALSAFSLWDGTQGMQTALARLKSVDPAEGDHLAAKVNDLWSTADGLLEVGGTIAKSLGFGRTETGQAAASRSEQFAGEVSAFGFSPMTGSLSAGGYSRPEGALFMPFSMETPASFETPTGDILFSAPVMNSWSLFGNVDGGSEYDWGGS